MHAQVERVRAAALSVCVAYQCISTVPRCIQFGLTRTRYTKHCHVSAQKSTCSRTERNMNQLALFCPTDEQVTHFVPDLEKILSFAQQKPSRIWVD